MPRIEYVPRVFSPERMAIIRREDEISSWRDEGLWDAATRRMEQEKAVLGLVSRRWDEVRALVGGE